MSVKERREGKGKRGEEIKMKFIYLPLLLRVCVAAEGEGRGGGHNLLRRINIIRAANRKISPLCRHLPLPPLGDASNVKCSRAK